MVRFLLAILLACLAPEAGAQSLEQILADIESLEADRDPKCYATASRLEDFMYGTPLTDEARFQKNRLQKRLAEIVWRIPEPGGAVGPEDIIPGLF